MYMLFVLKLLKIYLNDFCKFPKFVFPFPFLLKCLINSGLYNFVRLFENTYCVNVEILLFTGK